jgi:hypothetical protein
MCVDNPDKRDPIFTYLRSRLFSRQGRRLFGVLFAEVARWMMAVGGGEGDEGALIGLAKA